MPLISPSRIASAGKDNGKLPDAQSANSSKDAVEFTKPQVRTIRPPSKTKLNHMLEKFRQKNEYSDFVGKN